jgi:ribosome-binding protein aMBF1 (putative translation factor)
VGIWPEAFDKIHAYVLTIVRCAVKRIYPYLLRVASNKSQQAVCSRVVKILKEEREKRGLSMNLVAERAGLSQQMVSYVERNLRNPTLETFLRISAAIGIDPVEILRRSVGSKPRANFSL